jgi:hypothetical protein
MSFSKSKLIGDRAAHSPSTRSDSFQRRHVRAVQAYRRKYDTSVSPGMLRTYDISPAGFHVPSAFLSIVQTEVVNMLPFLREGHTYGVDELLGLQFLTVLDTGERRMVDQCIEILIRWGMPMQMVQTPAGQPSAYRFLGLDSRQGGCQ